MYKINQYWLFLISLMLFGSPVYALDLVYEASSPQIYAHPHDLILSPDQRLLYVADNGNDRIAVLEPDTLKLVRSIGKGDLSEPHDVAFDSKGRLLVADTGNDRIVIYQLEGTRARIVDALSESISRPEGVTPHANGRVYATGAGSDNIAAYAKGKVIAQQGGLASPHDVSVAPDGSLWIADAANNRLVNITQDLKIIQILEGEPYKFNGPRYLDYDQWGRLYVADKYNNQVKVLDRDLKLLRTVGGKASTFGPGYFNRPEGITIHGDKVWFSDTYNDRIVRYRIVNSE